MNFNIFVPLDEVEPTILRRFILLIYAPMVFILMCVFNMVIGFFIYFIDYCRKFYNDFLKPCYLGKEKNCIRSD